MSTPRVHPEIFPENAITNMELSDSRVTGSSYGKKNPDGTWTWPTHKEWCLKEIESAVKRNPKAKVKLYEATAGYPPKAYCCIVEIAVNG